MPSIIPRFSRACRRHHRLLRLTWSALLSGVVLWPFLLAVVSGLGDALAGDRQRALVLRDMVIPGEMALNDLATGSDGVARAVPQDAVLALFSPVIPPPVLVGLLMLGGGVAGSIGAGLLARHCGARWPGQALASFLVLWNPYVAERLLQGQWSVVLAAILCPLIAVLALRQRHLRSLIALLLVLAVCSLTPTGLLLGLLTATVASGWRHRTLVPLVAGTVLSLPWVVPSVLCLSGTVTDSHSAELFAARAEPGVGTLGALAGLGGIWNADAVPDHRLPWAGVTLAVLAVVIAVVMLRRGEWTGVLRRLSLLAVGAVLLPALLSTGGGVALLGEVLEVVPGAGLFRDTQKFVVLALPALVILLSRADVLVAPRGGDGEVGIGDAAERGGPASDPGGAPPRATTPMTAVVTSITASITASLIWLQVPALPADLTDLAPLELDERYTELTEYLDNPDATGVGPSPRTLLWPPGNYRLIEGRPALDPLLKMLPGRPVDPGYLIVDGHLVDGDATIVQLLSGLAEGEDGLAEAGIDLVLVEGSAVAATPGATIPEALSRHEVVWSSGDWTVYRVRASHTGAG